MDRVHTTRIIQNEIAFQNEQGYRSLFLKVSEHHWDLGGLRL